jgi:hypothetical protein
LGFYGASGVRLLAIPYFQPRLRSYLPRGYHMFLGVIPPLGTTLPAALPAGPVSAFLREYFEDCEGPAVREEEEVQQLLEACGGPWIDLVRSEDFGRLPAEAGHG